MAIAVAALAVAALVCVGVSDDPEVLKEVKIRYRRLREILIEDGDQRWAPLYQPCLLVGLDRRRGELGWNTNKGYEIGLCIDGTANQVFHVLLHELAHCLTIEYEHNEEFWKNFADLREVARSNGLYEPIPAPEGFCDKKIKDP